MKNGDEANQTSRVFDVVIVETIAAIDDQHGPVNFSTGIAEQCKAKAG